MTLTMGHIPQKKNVILTAAPGGTLTRSVALCYPWPGTNDKAPVYSIAERAGVSLCLAGPSAGRCGPCNGVGV